MPEIHVNGELRSFDPPLTLARLVAEVTGTDERRGLAVARNGAVIPRSGWDDEPVEPGDDVEIAAPFAGG